MAVSATRPPGKTRRREGAMANVGRFLEIPRVGFLIGQGLALAGAWLCFLSLPRVAVDEATSYFLGLLLPIAFLCWSAIGLVRRSLATGFPGALAAFAAGPILLVAGMQTWGAPGIGWYAEPWPWLPLLAGILVLAAVPARRCSRLAGTASRLRLGVFLSFLVVFACAFLPLLWEGARAFPLDAIGLGGIAVGLVSGIALALVLGPAEPVGERTYGDIADRDQAILTWLILVAALGWSAQAWHSRGQPWDSMALAPANLLPTILLYALPVVSFQWLVFGRRWSTKGFWAVALVLSFLPFLDWSRANSAFAEGIGRHYASITSFPRREPSPEIPDVVFDLGRAVNAKDAMAALGGMRLYDAAGGGVMGILPDGTKAPASLPDRYFLVKPVPFASGFPGAKAMEVQQVDYGKAVPLGLDVESRAREPVFPPLPTSNGWLTAEKVLHETDAKAARATTQEAKASAFVAAVLKGKAFVRNPLD